MSSKDHCGPWCYWRPCMNQWSWCGQEPSWCPRPVLPSNTTQMSMCAIAWGHVDICCFTVTRGHTNLSGLMDTWGHGDIWISATAEGYAWVQCPGAVRVCVDIHGPPYYQKLRRCSCLYWWLKSWWCLLAMFLLWDIPMWGAWDAHWGSTDVWVVMPQNARSGYMVLVQP